MLMLHHCKEKYISGIFKTDDSELQSGIGRFNKRPGYYSICY